MINFESLSRYHISKNKKSLICAHVLLVFHFSKSENDHLSYCHPSTVLSRIENLNNKTIK